MEVRKDRPTELAGPHFTKRGEETREGRPSAIGDCFKEFIDNSSKGTMHY